VVVGDDALSDSVVEAVVFAIRVPRAVY
jgi:hypothetical protein